METEKTSRRRRRPYQDGETTPPSRRRRRARESDATHPTTRRLKYRLAKNPAENQITERYRPQTFDALVGQDSIADALRGFVSDPESIGAVMFEGPASAGKTTMGRILARALVCENPDIENGRHCGECVSCRIPLEDHPDVQEVNAAQKHVRGIDGINKLVARMNLSAVHTRRVVILDECHQLTDAAREALLKILEKPPKHVTFILCTTDSRQLKHTFLTRCKRFEPRPIPPDLVVDLVLDIIHEEGFHLEEAVAVKIVEAARGVTREVLQTVGKLVASFRAGKQPNIDQMVRELTSVENCPSDQAVRNYVMAVLDLKTLTAVWSAAKVTGDPLPAMRSVLGFIDSCMRIADEGKPRYVDARLLKDEIIKDTDLPVLATMYREIAQHAVALSTYALPVQCVLVQAATHAIETAKRDMEEYQ